MDSLMLYTEITGKMVECQEEINNGNCTCCKFSEDSEFIKYISWSVRVFMINNKYIFYFVTKKKKGFCNLSGLFLNLNIE